MLFPRIWDHGTAFYTLSNILHSNGCESCACSERNQERASKWSKSYIPLGNNQFARLYLQKWFDRLSDGLLFMKQNEEEKLLWNFLGVSRASISPAWKSLHSPACRASSQKRYIELALPQEWYLLMSTKTKVLGKVLGKFVPATLVSIQRKRRYLGASFKCNVHSKTWDDNTGCSGYTIFKNGCCLGLSMRLVRFLSCTYKFCTTYIKQMLKTMYCFTTLY